MTKLNKNIINNLYKFILDAAAILLLKGRF